MHTPHDPDELIAIVDDADKVIGVYPRKNHAEGRLHRETSVLIVNPNYEILIQTRADNGLLDYSASGHFPAEESYLQGAVREVQEELGLTIASEAFVEVSKYRVDCMIGRVNRRFITLWQIQGDYRIEDMQIDLSEVSSVRYVSVSELKCMMQEGPEKFSEGFLFSLQKYFEYRSW